MLVMTLSGIHCPIRAITGIPCPTCGFTRAALALLQGDIVRSLRIHPMLLPVLVSCLLFFHARPLKEKLMSLPEDREIMVTATELKDPTTLLLISIFLGSWGVDRFMLGDTGMGVLKLLTGGVCGVLTIIDWFTVQNKTKELNFNRLMQLM